MTLTRLQLFQAMQEVPLQNQINYLLQFILQKLSLTDCPSKAKQDLKHFIKLFIDCVSKRKAKIRKDTDTFVLKSRSWLNKDFTIPDSILCLVRDSGSNRDNSSSSTGRPTISFDNSSDRTKRRKVAKLLSSHSLPEIVSATCTGVRNEGKRKLANHIAQHVASGHIPKLVSPVIRTYTDDEALSFFVEGKFSKFQYKMMRIQSKERGADLYPNYHRILEAKKRCYPKNMNITDKCAEVPLQSLLDHTTTRILEISQPILTAVDNSLENVELIVKWGFDGTSEQSQYKQRAEFNDTDLFVTWLVPLQLQTISKEGHLIILWKNPRPSSVRFCRPIRLQFLKETKEAIKIEREYIETQISQLTLLTVTNPIKITVKYRLTLTMADGKVWSALTDTSGQVCYICKATPKQMNKLDLVCDRSLDKTTLAFGISPLHCWIRCFECLLHISYRIDIKKWRVISKTDKEKVKSRKEIIQSKFRTQMGLIVDIPKQGSGTTNDGNTARRFFENPGVVSMITNIDENLIKKFGIILKTISCGFSINEQKFSIYCHKTAKLYVQFYNWYPMPASVHKLLVHGAAIVSTAILPIGLLSEEAQEARNKDVKYIREHNTRKCSRIATNEDLFGRLLISSDPLITSLRREPPRKTSTISREVIELLSEPEFRSYNTKSSTESSGESSEEE